jgi:hypothetical protein
MPEPGRPSAAGARHEYPRIDELALAAARHLDRLVAAARERGLDRWVAYLDPLPDRLRDEDLRGLRAAALRLRSAYGAKDSVRDALPADLTEPVLEATDRLLRELNREANRARG